MEKCKVCKMAIGVYEGYVHEYSFGSALRTEVTHDGICAEIFEEQLQEVYVTDSSDDEKLMLESLEDKFDEYQFI